MLPGAACHSQRPSLWRAKPNASASGVPCTSRPPHSSSRPSERAAAVAYILQACRSSRTRPTPALVAEAGCESCAPQGSTPGMHYREGHCGPANTNTPASIRQEPYAMCCCSPWARHLASVCDFAPLVRLFAGVQRPGIAQRGLAVIATHCHEETVGH